MPYTIHSYNDRPTHSTRWNEAAASDRKGYTKFTAKIEDKELNKITTKIICFSLATFGIYYLFLLCTKQGRKDLKNLKDRVSIHYVKHQKVETEENDPVTKTNLKGKKLLGKTAINPPVVKKPEQLTSTVLKKIFAKVKVYEGVQKDLTKMIADQGHALIDALYVTDPKLAASVDKYFSTPKDDQSLKEFMQTLAPFLKEKEDVADLLKRAMVSAQNQKGVQSEASQAHKEFLQTLDDVASKSEWLLSIKDNQLLEFSCDIIQKPYYSDFVDKFNKHPDLFKKCLQSMKAAPQIEPTLHNEVKELFKQATALRARLNENIAKKIGLNEQGFSYAPNKYFFYGPFKVAYQTMKNLGYLNSLDDAPDFIKMFVQDKKNLSDTLNILNGFLDINAKEIENACKTAHTVWKLNEVADEKAVGSKKVVDAYQLLKGVYNENKDLIYIIKCSESFLKDTLGEPFFLVLNQLSSWTFTESAPNKSFVSNMKNHFDKIDGFVKTVKELRRLEE